MNANKDLLEQFDKLGSIQPSPEWKDRLFQKLDRYPNHKGNTGVPKLAWVAILLLLATNVLMFALERAPHKSEQGITRLKNIATEFMVSTSSSEY